MKNSKSSEEVAIYYALIQSGEIKFLPKFLKGFDSNNYTVRCATANLSTNFSEKKLKIATIKKIRSVLKSENSLAAKNDMEHALEYLK